jgi:hypothetical protein
MGKGSSFLKASHDLKDPGNDFKVDWHSMLNFGIIITDYEGNIIEFFMSLLKVAFMKIFTYFSKVA